MKGYLDFERIEELSAVDNESGTIYRQVIKLQEEVGEVSSAYLAFIGSENASATSLFKEDLSLELLEEVIDSMIVCADLINALTVPEDEDKIKELADRKLLKWSSKLNNIAAKKKEKAINEFIK